MRPCRAGEHAITVTIVSMIFGQKKKRKNTNFLELSVIKIALQ